MSATKFLESLNYTTASYKGVGFLWFGDNYVTRGRSVRVNETQNDNGEGKVQDNGLVPKQYTISCEPINTTAESYNELLKTFESEGAGVLVHPFDGELLVIAGDLQTSATQEAIGKYNILVTFTVTSDIVYPNAPDSAGGVQNQADDTRESFIDKIKNGIEDFDLASAIGYAASFFDYILYNIPNSVFPFDMINNASDVFDSVGGILDSRKGSSFDDAFDSAANDYTGGSAGGIKGRGAQNNVTDNFSNSKEGLAAQCVTVAGFVETIGSVFTGLTSKNTNISQQAGLVNELIDFGGSVSFGKSAVPSDFIENNNNVILECYVQKLILLEVCKRAVVAEYDLLQDILDVENRINQLSNLVFDKLPNDKEDIQPVVDAALEVLRQKELVAARVKPELFNNIDLFTLCYQNYGNIDDKNINLLKRINPNRNYANMTGEVFVVDVN